MTADLTVCGFGPGPWNKMTLEVRDILLAADRIFVRDSLWEVCQQLTQRGKRLLSLQPLYHTGIPPSTLYDFMANILIQSCLRYGPAVYALPGNPFVFEYSASMLLNKARQAGLSVRVVEGMSCLETIFCTYQLDPGGGMQILNFMDWHRHGRLDPEIPSLIFQVGAPIQSEFSQSAAGYLSNLERLDHLLAQTFPQGHTVYLLTPSEDDNQQLTVSGLIGSLPDKLRPHLTLYSTLLVPPTRWFQ